MIKAVPIKINWHPGLSIFASEPFLKAVGDEYGWLGGLDDSGKLMCILPFTVIRKAFIRMVRFRVETIPVNEDFDIEEEKAFLNSAMKYFHSIGAGLVIPATANTIFRTCPDGAITAPYGSFVLDLTAPEESLWKNVHSKHRNVIRNAAKNGVEIKSGTEYLDIAYELIRDTLKRSKVKFMSQHSFRCFVSSVKENTKIFVADYKGTVQGVAVIPFSDYSAYYLYGGSNRNTISGATNLLQWEAIRSFRNLGVRRYDFVGARINPEKGSKQKSLMAFKQRFGGQLVQGYMWKYALNPLRYGVYALAVGLLRGGDVVDQERHKLCSERLSYKEKSEIP